MSSGSHRPVPVYTALIAVAAAGRAGTNGRSVGRSPPTRSSRTQTSTPSSWAGYGSQPANGPPASASPCQWHTNRPQCTAPCRSGAPRCGQAPGPARSRPVRSRQATTSVHPTVRPNGRDPPARMTSDAPSTNQLPDGRAWARFRVSAISAGPASRQVGRCSAHASLLRNRSGTRRRACSPPSGLAPDGPRVSPTSPLPAPPKALPPAGSLAGAQGSGGPSGRSWGAGALSRMGGPALSGGSKGPARARRQGWATGLGGAVRSAEAAGTAGPSASVPAAPAPIGVASGPGRAGSWGGVTPRPGGCPFPALRTPAAGRARCRAPGPRSAVCGPRDGRAARPSL